MAKKVAFFPSRGQNVIATSEDYILETTDDQVHVFSDTDPVPVPPPTVKLTLPCNPGIGERHKIVANSANVTLDGNGSPIVDPGNLTPNEVPAGSCIDLVFSSDEDLPNDCNCNGNGQWHVC